MADGTWTPGPASGPAFQTNLPQTAPPRRRGVLSVILTILLILSVAANGVLLLAVIGLGSLVGGTMGGGLGAGGMEDNLLERVVERGPAASKILVLPLEGLIYDPMVDHVARKLRRARRDDSIKAVILRINSPGGYLTSSDVLYNEIKTFAEDTGIPVVASMDAVAASGGYYAACAADTIVAQRTTVTGSIGIIAQYFFLNGLMQDKLGIRMVTLKMGEQKDWPNMFAGDMTPEQTEYIMTRLLEPGYEQFLQVVAEGREMDPGKVRRLATGSIFMAAEAKENGLIDEIGYFAKAVEIAKERAGLTDARIVEYVQVFSFMDLFGASAQAKTLLDLRPETLSALASPRVMALWTGY